MPIWLRTFTFNSLKDMFDKQKEAMDKKAKKLKGGGEIAKPNIKPNYTTKTSK